MNSWQVEFQRDVVISTCCISFTVFATSATAAATAGTGGPGDMGGKNSPWICMVGLLHSKKRTLDLGMLF